MSTRQSDLQNAIRRAGWEPAKIRADIAGLPSNPLFAGLPQEILDAAAASGERHAREIEQAGRDAEAELARRRARMPHITPGRIA